MSQATKILSINGSYRDGGATDQAIQTMVRALTESGAKVETIALRDYPIEFCLNCRSCTQQQGSSPGRCVHEDDMQSLVEKIERADGYILAAPTNLGSVTAIFKRFMERLIVFAYWPWGVNAPAYRKARLPKKKAVLVSSCAAPGWLGRWIYRTEKQLRMTAQIIGANSVGTLFTGLVSAESEVRLSHRRSDRAAALAKKLL